jgi:hypothetical protein
MSRAKSLTAPVALLAALVLLPGCSTDDDAPAKSDAEKQQALEESAFGDMTSALDRAKEVEDLSADRKRQLDEAMDQ